MTTRPPHDAAPCFTEEAKPILFEQRDYWLERALHADQRIRELELANTDLRIRLGDYEEAA